MAPVKQPLSPSATEFHRPSDGTINQCCSPVPDLPLLRGRLWTARDGVSRQSDGYWNLELRQFRLRGNAESHIIPRARLFRFPNRTKGQSRFASTNAETVASASPDCRRQLAEVE